jgi:hypothetical protein
MRAIHDAARSAGGRACGKFLDLLRWRMKTVVRYGRWSWWTYYQSASSMDPGWAVVSCVATSLSIQPAPVGGGLGMLPCSCHCLNKLIARVRRSGMERLYMFSWAARVIPSKWMRSTSPLVWVYWVLMDLVPNQFSNLSSAIVMNPSKSGRSSCSCILGYLRRRKLAMAG